MRVAFGELQPPFQFAYCFSAEHMLDLIGIFVHMIGGEMHGVR